MKEHEMLISEHACKSFRRIVNETQEVSLIAAEKLRQLILHKFHYIHHHPEQGSSRADFGNGLPEFRVVQVLSYKIYYCVRDKSVIIAEILVSDQPKAF